MTLHSYAKVNLGLRILRKRPDGFHDLETIFHEIDLFDDIEFVPSSDISLSTSDPSLLSDSSNLCMKAALLMRDLFSPGSGVRMMLRKRIPIGSGLGGGSSNAAAVLRGLRTLWNVSATDQELETLASQLGSDVSFFVRGGSAYATGRGEIVRPLDLKFPYWLVTATPDLHVSTPWAYQALQWPSDVPAVHLPAFWEKDADDSIHQSLRNDFEPVVLASYPAIGEMKSRMLSLGATAAAMSGSGSTVFGLFAEQESAEAALSALTGPAVVSLTSPSFRPERM